jgi:hypothetical protein
MFSDPCAHRIQRSTFSHSFHRENDNPGTRTLHTQPSWALADQLTMFLRSTGQEQLPPQIGGQTNQTKRPGWEWMGGARFRREPLHKSLSVATSFLQFLEVVKELAKVYLYCHQKKKKAEKRREQTTHTLGKDADAQDETASRGPDTPFQRDPVLQSLHITSHDSQIFSIPNKQ